MEIAGQHDQLYLEPRIVKANGWKRLANFLIDYVILLLLAAIFFIILEILSPTSEYTDDYSAGKSGFALLENILYSIIYAVYMALFEIATKGRSIGKLITGTKVVNEDGTDIDAATAFKRGFSRVVPFEIFSALGSPCYPWHDKWTNTYVIDIKASSIFDDSIYPEPDEASKEVLST